MNSDELAAALVEHTQRAVAGTGEPGRRVDDAAQHVGQAQVAGDADHGVEQATGLVAGQVGQPRGISGGR